MTGEPCTCEACVLAGCDKPPVTLAKLGNYPERQLHGRELKRWYANEDTRKVMWDAVKRRINQIPGITAQRGDEPR